MKTIMISLSVLLIFYSGILCSQNVKNDDPLNGLRKDYYPNGKLCKEYFLSDGVPVGVYRFYSEKGFLVAEQKLVEGIQQGIQKTFFEGGQVQSETNYEKGVPQGIKKEYYKDGTLKSESYLTGEPWEFTGYTTLYYEDGKKKSESKVSMGKLIIAITYDKEGRVTTEQTEGKIISYWYDRDGKKHTSINGVDQDK